MCSKVSGFKPIAALGQMISPIHHIAPARLPLLLICSLSHRNRKEDKETDGRAGEWLVRDTMLTASLPPPTDSQPLRSLLCGQWNRLTISLTILYTSRGEQWRLTTKNSGNRGTTFFSLGWLLRAGPVDTHRPAETDRCQRHRVKQLSAATVRVFVGIIYGRIKCTHCYCFSNPAQYIWCCKLCFI